MNHLKIISRGISNTKLRETVHRKINPKFRMIETNPMPPICHKQVKMATTVAVISSVVSFFATAYGFDFYRNTKWYQQTFVDDEE